MNKQQEINEFYESSPSQEEVIERQEVVKGSKLNDTEKKICEEIYSTFQGYSK